MVSPSSSATPARPLKVLLASAILALGSLVGAQPVFISGDPSIKTLADLKGKTVSFGLAVQHLGPPEAAQLSAAGPY